MPKKFQQTIAECANYCSRSGVDDAAALLGHEAAFTVTRDRYLTLNVGNQTPSDATSRPRRKDSYSGLYTTDEDITVPQHIRKYLTNRHGVTSQN